MNDKMVIVADKQDITSIGIGMLVSRIDNDYSVVKADNKKELVSLLSSTIGAMVILDYTLFDFIGVDDLLNVDSRFQDTKWLLFSDDLSIDFLRRLVHSSAAFSVVHKMCDADEIRMAIVHTLRGERYICSRVTNQLLLSQKTTSENKDNILTPTEREILKEIAMGKTTKEIAAERNLSIHTIITHRKNIFRKLEVNNVYEATRYAARAGIIDVADYYI